jgi:hypothetical protein
MLSLRNIFLVVNKMFFFVDFQYAYTSWTLSTNPSGLPQPAILFIPMQNNMLIGAAFPLTGIPDFSINLPPAAAAGLTNQAIMEQLQRLPPEQQKHAVALMKQRHMRARPQGQLQPQLPLQQQQQQPQPPPPQQQQQLPMDMNLNMFMSANPGAMSSAALAGLFGGGQQQLQNAGGLPQQALSGSGVAQGPSGGMVNVSYEMLQSFMQRNVNADGSSILPT